MPGWRNTKKLNLVFKIFSGFTGNYQVRILRGSNYLSETTEIRQSINSSLFRLKGVRAMKREKDFAILSYHVISSSALAYWS